MKTCWSSSGFYFLQLTGYIALTGQFHTTIFTFVWGADRMEFLKIAFLFLFFLQFSYATRRGKTNFVWIEQQIHCLILRAYFSWVVHFSCEGFNNTYLAKVHSFLKQCLHDLHFMKTSYFSPNLYKLAPADNSWSTLFS